MSIERILNIPRLPPEARMALKYPRFSGKRQVLVMTNESTKGKYILPALSCCKPAVALLEKLTSSFLCPFILFEIPFASLIAGMKGHVTLVCNPGSCLDYILMVCAGLGKLGVRRRAGQARASLCDKFVGLAAFPTISLS